MHYGRKMIMTDETVVTPSNILNILQKTFPYHEDNRRDIQYLYDVYRGKQDVLNREKQYRPEICNCIVENRANEIVSFKTGHLIGEPVQYVSRGKEDILDAINKLNEYMFAEEKASKDKELADWFHICGTSYRMGLPDDDNETDDSPFEIYILDPRYAYVVYHNGLGNKPVMGVKYVNNEDGTRTFSCYTKTDYFEVKESKLVKHEKHYLGEIPIVEYPLNNARLGAFEVCLSLLNAINTIQSNRVDAVEQFVQSLMLFHNVDISSEDFASLKEMGALKYRDIDPQMKAEVSYLTSTLNQTETQTLVDGLYQTVLTICGMPSQADGSTSDSSNNGAVILRNGWQGAEARAKESELMFKKSERKFLKLILNICKKLSDINLKVSDIEIRFTRRNYENIYQKAQVLDLMLKNEKVADKLAFEHSGMFADSDLAYTISHEEYEENKEQIKIAEVENDNTGDFAGDRKPAEEGQPSGIGD